MQRSTSQEDFIEKEISLMIDDLLKDSLEDDSSKIFPQKLKLNQKNPDSYNKTEINIHRVFKETPTHYNKFFKKDEETLNDLPSGCKVAFNSRIKSSSIKINKKELQNVAIPIPLLTNMPNVNYPEEKKEIRKGFSTSFPNEEYKLFFKLVMCQTMIRIQR
jgi:hypothetical protein